MKPKRFRIECTEEQARVISRACEMYLRAHLGQWDTVCDEALMHNRDLQGDARQAILGAIRHLATAYHGGPANSNLGVGSTRLAESANVAGDINQVVRHALWRARPKKDRCDDTVDAYPGMKFGKEPMCSCEEISDGPKK